MEMNLSNEVLDISVPFSGLFYLLNVEIDTFCGSVSDYFLEVCYCSIPVLVQYVFEVSDWLELACQGFLDPVVQRCNPAAHDGVINHLIEQPPEAVCLADIWRAQTKLSLKQLHNAPFVG